jgi:hypothetical protein
MPLPSGNRIALIGCSTRAVVREQHGSERAARAVHPGPSTAHASYDRDTNRQQKRVHAKLPS